MRTSETPPSAQTLFDDALRHHQAERLDQAQAGYRRLIELQPDCAEAHANLGVLLQQQGQSAEAIAHYEETLRLRPGQPEGLFNLGNALRESGRLDDAIARYAEALRIRPVFADALNNLGLALKEQGRIDEAVAATTAALRIRPDHSDAHTNLGLALEELGRLDEAEAAHRAAIKLKPDLAAAHTNLGLAQQQQGHLDAAEAAHRTAIALWPDFAEAHNNLGCALQRQGRLDAAIAAHRTAIALRPDLVAAHTNLAMDLLLQGEMAEGWREYEWRWKVASTRETCRLVTGRQWYGEAAIGKTLLIHLEQQGFGDTLQFCRYAAPVAARGWRVILEAQRPLARLLRTLPGVDLVVAEGDPPPAFDLHCPMFSLPLALGTVVETIPADIPYLHADPEQAAAWRSRLAAGADQGLRVGLVWAGNPHANSPALAALDRRRSLPFERLAPLFDIPGIRFFSLQKGRPAMTGNRPLSDFMDEMADFADTAALIANLDLVIAVDTAVAHLAGALGKPVWLLNRFDTCWRWLRERDDSPWYPTLRQFRQPSPGDWDGVIDQVEAELRRRVAT